jgi:hypothetical protein
MTLRSLTALLLLLGSTSALLPNETCALTGMAPKVVSCRPAIRTPHLAYRLV